MSSFANLTHTITSDYNCLAGPPVNPRQFLSWLGGMVAADQLNENKYYSLILGNTNPELARATGAYAYELLILLEKMDQPTDGPITIHYRFSYQGLHGIKGSRNLSPHSEVLDSQGQPEGYILDDRFCAVELHQNIPELSDGF